MYQCGDKKRDKLAPRKMIRVGRGTERRVEMKRHRFLMQQELVGTKVQGKGPIPNLPVQVPAQKWARRRSER